MISHRKNSRSSGAPRSEDEWARTNLDVDICRFERYALTIINLHGYKISVTDGKPYWLEFGQIHRRPVYDHAKLAKIANRIANRITRRFKRAKERKLNSKDQALFIAARIAIAIPTLRDALQRRTITANFASAMCRISAAVPDNHAAARLIDEKHRTISSKGGSVKKINEHLQKFIAEIVGKLSRHGHASAERVWNHLVNSYSNPSSAVDHPTDFDDPHVDGNKLCWTDSAGKQHSIAKSSLRRYIARAPQPK